MTGVPPAPSRPARPAVLAVLGRVLRVRCPACGEGRIFEHALRSALRFRGARRCSACDWWLERGPGHWVGGTEINIVATYLLAVPLFTAVVLSFGLSAVTLGATALFTAIFPLAAYRHSRALFFALDYLIDPTPDPSEHGDALDGGGAGGGDGSDRPDPDPPLPPPRAPRRTPPDASVDDTPPTVPPTRHLPRRSTPRAPRPWVRPPAPRPRRPRVPS